MPPVKLNLQPLIVRAARVSHPSGTIANNGTIPGFCVRCHQCSVEFLVDTGAFNRGRGVFCSRTCSGLYRRREPIDILMSRVVKLPPDRLPTGCWEWTGFRDGNGYGSVRLADNKQWLTHRLAWTLIIGPIPEGLGLCHCCDNPPCCNPDRLFPGTQADNMQDAVAKGRPVGCHAKQKVKR